MSGLGGWVGRRLRRVFRIARRRSAELDSRRDEQDERRGSRSERLSGNARRDAEHIRRLLGEPPELVIRPIDGAESQAILVYIDGLVDQNQVAEHIIAPLTREPSAKAREPFPAQQSRLETLDGAASALLLGHCVLLRDREGATAYDVRNWAKRAVEQVQTEPTEVGPREGFTEDLATNLALVRRRLRTHRFRSEQFVLGEQTRTQVRLLYLAGIARNELVAEVRHRLRSVDIDGVLGINHVDELTSDNPLSPFPSTVTTERPDRVASMMLEGNVAILVDGSPLALVMPGTFSALLQSSDDFHQRFFYASFTRMVRWISVAVGLMAPSIYVSLISYHHELVPTRLLFTIAASREGIPFPPIIEAVLMEMAFEVLREAGLRMPRQFGQALSIVGVLVIGESAVRAGLVSPLMIVVVGMTAIATFAIPATPLANAIRLLRFPMMALAGVLGLFGVFFGFMLVVGLLVSSRSYGVPYLTPVIPVWFKGLQDATFRGPVWWHQMRPWYTARPGQLRRQPPGQKPQPKGPRPGERP
ncbi:MAG: spore germination protein [Firmicutes bacterium]|nr:spore germination protein [Bacillota bacterium]